jgi:hypothetical protein
VVSLTSLSKKLKQYFSFFQGTGDGIWIQHGIWGCIDFMAIWSLNPFMSPEKYDQILATLKTDHGVDTSGPKPAYKLKRIDWTGYTIGDLGERFSKLGSDVGSLKE